MDLGSILNLGSQDATPAASAGGPSVDAAKPAAGPGLMDQWNSFLSKPGNTAAVVQAGLNMMQPIGVGQSVLGHMAQAVGAGGEAKRRNLDENVDRELKTAQSDYYSGRAANTGSLTPAQIMASDDRTKAAYSKVLMEELSAIDPLDPASALADLRKDPKAFAAFMQNVSQLYQASQQGPNLTSQIAPGGKTPGPQAIAYLKANPKTKAQFEATFGPGSAAQFGVK